MRNQFARFFAILVVLTAGVAEAQVNRRAVDAAFQEWLAGEMRAEARAAGVSERTYAAAIDGLRLDWDLPDLQPPGAPPPRVEHQAEFRSPARYFDEDQLKGLIRAGRRQANEWKQTLDRIERQYGVPRTIILAIWGRESAFGNASIPNDAVRTLATRAYIGRRKEFYRPEFIAVLKILESGDVSRSHLRGSWAGALGQPQFLPSHYLRVAVDFDGDGHRDIWNSVPDTLASIAAFLREAGWNPAESWGVEAMIPDGVPCTLEGPHQGAPISAWEGAGATRIDGGRLASRGDPTGHLLMPAGRFGPAFIVSGNFYVLKEYNESDLYALFIGHVADRLVDDSGPFKARWGRFAGFSRGDVTDMQEALVAQGYDVGGADGLVGFRTRIAIGGWQQRAGQKPTCFPDAGLIEAIR